MNAAKLAPGSRTLKLLDLFEKWPRGLTSKEIAQLLPCVAPATEVSALRHVLADGRTIEARCVSAKRGVRVWLYRLVTLPLSTRLAAGAAHLQRTPSAAPATLFEGAP